MAIEFRCAISSDIETLVAIRIAAMKESLENIGRFDPQRARERLVENFRPDDTTLILHNGEVIGFYSFLQLEDTFKLEHLYVYPAHQGKGTGCIALDRIKQNARERSCSITLLALKGSKANEFYSRHGFVQYGEDTFDNLYCWRDQLYSAS